MLVDQNLFRATLGGILWFSRKERDLGHLDYWSREGWFPYLADWRGSGVGKIKSRSRRGISPAPGCTRTIKPRVHSDRWGSPGRLLRGQRNGRHQFRLAGKESAVIESGWQVLCERRTIVEIGMTESDRSTIYVGEAEFGAQSFVIAACGKICVSDEINRELTAPTAHGAVYL